MKIVRARIAGLLVILLILINSMSLGLVTTSTWAQDAPEDLIEEIRRATLTKDASTLEGADSTVRDWQNIFERSVGEPAPYDWNTWQFDDTSEWSQFAYLEGEKTRIIVGLDDDESRNLIELQRLVAEHQAKVVNTVSIKGKVTAAIIELPLTDVAHLVAEIRGADLARYVEPDMKVSAQYVPNDPRWFSQWGPQKIGADWAWNTTMGSDDMLVAVLDTGIDYTHEDLATNYLPLGYDWINMDGDPMDDHGHGTHCAGTIAAATNNSVGIAGLAQVKIMAEKVLDEGGYGLFDGVANGIINATDLGANIISMSLGGYGDSELVHEAVRYAYDAGVLIVAAAGNDNTNMLHYPSAYDEVVAVAASDQMDRKVGFSNWGDWNELAAPGVSIISTVPGGYQYGSGTSMATPHVSGVAALVWGVHPNKTRDWVRMWLQYTAKDLGDEGFDVYFGYGRVDARNAIEQPPPQHELIAFAWSTPPYVEPGGFGTVNASILNFGEADESNVTVHLLANGTFVDSTVVAHLPSGDSSTVSLTWNPSTEGLYNITVSVAPAAGETNIENNALTTYLYAGFPVKAAVLHSSGNIEGNSIINWQTLNTEWFRFGDTMVYIDYASLNKEEITYEEILATEADVLVISCAYSSFMGWEFSDSEIEAIRQYVYEGHGLIATAGTLYEGVPNNNKLAVLFGLNETTRWSSTGTDLLHLANETHPIFADVPNPLVFPSVGTGIPSDGIWDSNELVGGEYLALGQFQESAVVAFRGLAYIAPWLEIIPPYYRHHLQLLYNAIRWSSYQRPEHELVASLDAPTRLEPGESTVLNATVANLGKSNETDVTLQLLINGEVIDEILLPEMLTGNSYTLSYDWTPTILGLYNVTAYAPSILGEKSIINNAERRMVRVSYEPEILVLDVYGDEDTGALDMLGYHYTIVDSTQFATVDLHEYNLLFVGWAPGLPQLEALAARASEIADWVAYGNGIVALSEFTGVGDWAWLPLRASSYPDFHANSVHILNASHSVMLGLNDAELSNWGNSYHGYFTDYDPSWQALSKGVEADGTITLAAAYGYGRIAVTCQDPDFHLYYDHGAGARKLLINMIEWANVHIQHEHDVAVRLAAPKFQTPDTSTLLNATVQNRGTNNETDVEVDLYIDGLVVGSDVAPELLVGEAYSLSHLWTPTAEGIYNVTVYAPPLENETFLANNLAAVNVAIAEPLIQPMEGEYANYVMTTIDPGTGQEVSQGWWNFTYDRYISPSQMNITVSTQNPANFTTVGWMVVNIFTRIVERDSGLTWQGWSFPGWIETNVTIGSTVNLLDLNGTVVDNEVIYVGDQPVDCWEVELGMYGYEYSFFYDKASGLWVGMKAISTVSVGLMFLLETNVPLGFMLNHDLAVTLDVPARLQPETSVLVNCTVYNTGLHDESNVTVEIVIDGSQGVSETVLEIPRGACHTLSTGWVPIDEGIYNVTGYASPVPEETFVENNVVSKAVNVQMRVVALISDGSQLLTMTHILDSMNISYDTYNHNNVYFYTADLDLLLNYELIIFCTEYRWILLEEQTALDSYLSLGGNLLVTGFDSLVGDHRLAEVVRSSTVGDNMGEPDLLVVEEGHPIMNGPYGSFPAGHHVMGLFSDCDLSEADAARGAVTVAELNDGYDRIIATEGVPGKVVFWNGMGTEDWVWNSDCEAMLKNTIHWMTTKPAHDLAVSLEAPGYIAPGDMAILNATVLNGGLNNETGVDVQLWIEDALITNATVDELLPGTSYTLSSPWSPAVDGVYNVTAYAPPVAEEALVSNNKLTRIVSVGLPPNITAVYVSPLFSNMTLGEATAINVNIGEVADLYAYQLAMFYSRSILNCTGVTLPQDHFMQPDDPANLFIVRLEFDNDFNSTHGRIQVAMTLLAPEKPKTGSGTLACMSFQAIALGDSALSLSGTKLADSRTNPIPHMTVAGHIVVETPPAIRDVALLEVHSDVDEPYEGWTVQILVTARNLGNLSETFDVRLYCGNTSIGTETITDLASGEKTPLHFNWTASGVELYVNHTIWAEADRIPGETDTDNNISLDGPVMVKLLGDVNGDRIVEMLDLVRVGAAFGSQPSDIDWSLSANLVRDHIIDVYDIVKVALNMGLEH